jgi:hypothetical protein
MRATLNGHQVVNVLEVGRLSSRVRYRRGQDGDTVTMWARNLELDPEPCGACLGKGCKACEGRGHSPRKSRAVRSLGTTLGRLGLQQAIATVLSIRAEKVERDFIDAGKCPKCALELHEGECP